MAARKAARTSTPRIRTNHSGRHSMDIAITAVNTATKKKIVGRSRKAKAKARPAKARIRVRSVRLSSSQKANPKQQ